MTSHIDEMNTPPPPLLLPLLPDIGNAVDAVFNHDVNQSAVGDVDNAFASLNSLVATADSTELFVNTYDSFDVNQSAVGDVDNAFASLDSLVATADSTELFVKTYDSFTAVGNLVNTASSNVMILGTNANFTAISNMVESARPTIINNVLRRGTLRPLNDAITRRYIADELLTFVALIVEQANVDALVNDVLSFVV